ncbi:MAG: hypothetical protein Q4F24_15345 [Eubacteriales bacterium]|nr:hypothetical protein [Eubacteriales bacterium]
MKRTTIEQELKDTGRCLIQTVGVSMEPLLHNRYSSVVLEEIKQPLKLYDVVLFQRPSDGDYVLHRIVKIREHDYLICGDNCIQKEPVLPEQIIGIMTGYFNGDDFADCAADVKYKRYVRSLPCRYLYRWCRAFPGRVVRRLKRGFSWKE